MFDILINIASVLALLYTVALLGYSVYALIKDRGVRFERFLNSNSDVACLLFISYIASIVCLFYRLTGILR